MTTFPNRDTLELRIVWVFPANPGVQTNFHGFALIIVNISNTFVILIDNAQ